MSWKKVSEINQPTKSVVPCERRETQHRRDGKGAASLGLPGKTTQTQHRNATGIAKLNTQLNTVSLKKEARQGERLSGLFGGQKSQASRRVRLQKKGGENLRLCPWNNLIPESSGLQKIPNTWRRTGDHYAHAREGTLGKMGCCHDDNAHTREGTLERGDTRRHPPAKGKALSLPEWGHIFAIYFSPFLSCVWGMVWGKKKALICNLHVRA